MNGNVATLWTIVLAAGGSSRLGRPKQLLRVGGRSLIARAVGIAQRLTRRRVIVVVGAQQVRMRAILAKTDPTPIVVMNAHWRSGMSSSLRRGLSALPQRAAAALVLTIDQPFVGAGDLRRLIAAWSRTPQRSVAAYYDGRLGVPAILPRRLWRLSRRARGDMGARVVLRNPRIRTASVIMPAAGVDIDTPSDLAKLVGRRR